MFYANSRVKLACCVFRKIELLIDAKSELLKVEKLSWQLRLFNFVEIMANLGWTVLIGYVEVMIPLDGCVQWLAMEICGVLF